MAELGIFPSGARMPEKLSELAAQIADDGGAVLAAFKEPIGGNWHLFAMLPADKVEATPFQRNLSPTHVKRLTEVMKKLRRYTEPIVCVRGPHGAYLTPNGNHRRAAAIKAGAQAIPAIVIAEPEVAYQILALNTEKVHNLKDKSLEVIRMYRARLQEDPHAAEKSFAFEFERAHFITLGMLYERKPRFSGGVYTPLLGRVDGFMARSLKDACAEREERAAAVERADELLAALVARGKKRGLNHPYLRNYIVARCNPLTRARKTLPSCGVALASLTRALEEFDLSRIHFGQLQGAAQIAAAAAAE